MTDPREVQGELERFVAARPDGGDATLEAIVASRLFGPAQVAQAKVARFTLLERVGRGSTGDVYAAYDPLLDRKVALKLLRTDGESHALDVDQREWLLREARAAARLVHPNVVAIHEVGEHVNGSVYVAMEFVAGRTLRTWLREQQRDGSVSAPERELILQVFVQAGLGLAAAHAAGLIHRDFKPENVLVCGEGSQLQCKVVDFGLAGVVEGRVGAEPSQALSCEFSTVAGTPAYMAPEQLRGQPLDARADQFSFCVALIEALSGQHPYLRDQEPADAEALIERIASREGVGLERSIPAWLRRAVERGMAVEAHARHPSMESLVAQLRAGPRRRRRVAQGLAAAGLLAGVVGLSIQLSQPAEQVSCSAAAELDGVWDDSARAQARAAFVAAEFDDPLALWKQFELRLDDYAGAWQLSRERRCSEDGPVLSASLQRLRESCLDRRRGELAGLSSLAVGGGRDALLAAVTAADRLTPLSSCEDLDSLAQEASLTAAGDEPAIDALRVEIATWTGQARSGFERELSPKVEELLARARELGAEVAEAEALMLASLVADASGDYAESVRSLEHALLTAISVRHHGLHAEAATRLVWAHGVRLRDFEAAARWNEHAEAAVRANRSDPVQLGRLLDHRGVIAVMVMDFEGAAGLHREAIEQFERASVPVERELIFARHNLGLALQGQSKHEQAELLLSESLDAARERLGPQHPDVAKMLGNLGQAYRAAGDRERAVALLEQSLALQEGLFGEQHIALFGVLSGLASTYGQIGRSAEAQEVLLRAVEIVEQHDGPQALRLEFLLHDLALEAWFAGQPEDTIKHASRALAIQEHHYGPSHPILALGHELIALARHDLGQLELAVAEIETALELLEGDEGQLRPLERGGVLHSAAIIEHAAGHPRARVEALADAARPLMASDPAALAQLDALFAAPQ